MLAKLKIPQTIYKRIIPLIPTPERVVRLSTLFKPQNQVTEKTQAPHIEGEKSPVEKAHEQHKMNQIREKDNQKEKVDRLIKKSNRRIMSISSFSIIPFNLFVNRIEVEESRVTFIFRQPFTFQSHSVDIADISNVFIESAFFFANMQVVSRTFIQNDITIGYLNKTEANKIRRIIEGLRTFTHSGIDTSVYEIDELIDKIEELHMER